MTNHVDKDDDMAMKLMKRDKGNQKGRGTGKFAMDASAISSFVHFSKKKESKPWPFTSVIHLLPQLITLSCSCFFFYVDLKVVR